MLRILFGIFIILHGLVHLLYFGQSARYFELQPGMVWPDGSWLISKLPGEGGTRTLASILLVLAAIGFVAAGIGVFAGQSWWHPVLAGAAVFSSVIFILFWNGTAQRLDNQGGVGILINLAILVALFGFHWPDFDF
jgi:uncharacterized membrane protein YphA (DoxX/SURF4 family)